MEPPELYLRVPRGTKSPPAAAPLLARPSRSAACGWGGMREHGENNEPRDKTYLRLSSKCCPRSLKGGLPAVRELRESWGNLAGLKLPQLR